MITTQTQFLGIPTLYNILTNWLNLNFPKTSSTNCRVILCSPSTVHLYIADCCTSVKNNDPLLRVVIFSTMSDCLDTCSQP